MTVKSSANISTEVNWPHLETDAKLQSTTKNEQGTQAWLALGEMTQSQGQILVHTVYKHSQNEPRRH